MSNLQWMNKPKTPSAPQKPNALNGGNVSNSGMTGGNYTPPPQNPAPLNNAGQNYTSLGGQQPQGDQMALGGDQMAGYQPTPYTPPPNSVPQLNSMDPISSLNGWNSQGTNWGNVMGPDTLKGLGMTNMDGTLKLDQWTNDEQRGAMKSMLENLGFPLAQMNMNQQQQAWDQLMQAKGFNQQGQMNQFNMGLANQQQSLQAWLAQEQARQFGGQLDLDTNVATWRYGPNGLEQQNIDTARYGIDQTTLRNTQNIQGQQDLQQLVNSGQIDLQSLVNSGALQQLGAQGQNQMNLQGLVNSGALANIGAQGQNQMNLQGLVNSGQIDLQSLVNSGQMSLQELVNSGQLGQIGAQGEQNRLLQQMQGQQQMSQLQKNLASQELQNRYNVFGRAQAPNAQMMASWR